MKLRTRKSEGDFWFLFPLVGVEMGTTLGRGGF